ncbi:MAG: hypothetical protein GDA36_13300 [Rhodobacteraceae bacterium]|nr:hypothetical protein [Paracoccaceae bacterium]
MIFLAGVYRQIGAAIIDATPVQSTAPPRQPFQCRHASAVGQARREDYAGRQDDI